MIRTADLLPFVVVFGQGRDWSRLMTADGLCCLIPHLICIQLLSHHQAAKRGMSTLRSILGLMKFQAHQGGVEGLAVAQQTQQKRVGSHLGADNWAHLLLMTMS